MKVGVQVFNEYFAGILPKSKTQSVCENHDLLSYEFNEYGKES